MMPPIARVDGHFRLRKLLASSGCGQVYAGTDILSQEKVAIKVVPLDDDECVLDYEAELYGVLKGGVGIPCVHWYGEEEGYNAMVMDRLGPSLEDLFNRLGRKFSLKTTILIAIQMIDRLEFIHSRLLIHHDIKPENVLIGVGAQESLLYAIDFGFATIYKDPDTHVHKKCWTNQGLSGTVRYASLNAQRGITQSRRDDIESLGYMLVYFLRGSLPWQALQGDADRDHVAEVLQLKTDTSIRDLCGALPSEFSLLLDHARSLGFEEQPHYAYLRAMFCQLLEREGFEDDGVFDWSVETTDSPVLHANGTKQSYELLSSLYDVNPLEHSCGKQ